VTRQASYTDSDGRSWAVLLPDKAPDEDAPMGLHVGPPSLDSLGLPKEVAIRLHNQLFDRGIFTLKEARVRRTEIFAALQAAYQVDSTILLNLYNDAEQAQQQQKEVTDGRPSKDPIQPRVHDRGPRKPKS
jgi:hypothetical protein